MELKIEYNFTPEEFLDIIIDVGWSTEDRISTAGLEKAMLSSTKLYCIRNDSGKILALARVLSDNYIFSTIPEIIVSKKFQRMELGTTLMNKIISDYGHTIIFFGAQPGNEHFAESFGFVKGPQSYTRHFSGFEK